MQVDADTGAGSTTSTSVTSATHASTLATQPTASTTHGFRSKVRISSLIYEVKLLGAIRSDTTYVVVDATNQEEDWVAQVTRNVTTASFDSIL
jgi:hypothetical protein